MKKLLTALLITTSVFASVPAKANADVVGALIIGGLIGHAISENDNKQNQPSVNVYPPAPAYPVYVPPPVYTPQPRYSPKYYNNNYPRHQPNPVYELMPVYDSSCNCHVMMPVRVR